jgi:hypothetical protein
MSVLTIDSAVAAMATSFILYHKAGLFFKFGGLPLKGG